MPKTQASSGYVSISNAKLYYEVSGSGIPIVMLHAGVADSRQWNNEFKHFSQYYQTVRYDRRGYGKSEPVSGKFSHLTDISEIFKTIQIDPPIIMMGCSMGGGLGIDYTLANPSKVKALIMVGSGPNGLELDVEEPAKFSDAEKAFDAGDLDQVAEIETQIWFDGIGRTPENVNQNMRQLAYEMNRTALGHEVKELGEPLADSDLLAYERLNEIDIPVLIIVGSQDVPYMHAAADYMDKGLKNSRVVIVEDAAHLPNMDQPVKFQRILTDFLRDLV